MASSSTSRASIWLVGVTSTLVIGYMLFLVYGGGDVKVTNNIVATSTATSTVTPMPAVATPATTTVAVVPVTPKPSPTPPRPPTSTTNSTTTTVSSTITPSPTPTTGLVCPVGYTCTTAGSTIVTSTTTTTTTSPAASPTPPPASAATRLVVSPVPLLTGGTAHAGATVPLSYLQITNTGTLPAHLKGFWLKQNGSASTDSVVGLTTVDDQGGSRGVSGASPFSDGKAFAPTDATFAPGQMRLFTIKAVINSSVAAYVGTQLMIDVTSIDTNATTVTGSFPIRGTTWTIAY